MIKKVLKSGSRFIDYKMAIGGSLVMGGIVFCINYCSTYNLSGSLTASAKQAGYTFLFGGFLMKGCEIIAKGINNKYLAVLLSVLIPSVITLLLTFIMHSMKGTPRPFESTLPTLIIIPATAIWGYLKRREFDAANR